MVFMSGMVLDLVKKRPRKTPGRLRQRNELTPLETEVIDLFVQPSRVLGFPKSTAEIYGLLFISPSPLAMDDLTARLNLSKGSASQGLKFLRNLGAVKTVYVAGDRRDHYEAENRIAEPCGRFSKGTTGSHFTRGLARLRRIEEISRQLSVEDRDEVSAKLDKLRHWEKSGKQLIPWIVKFFREVVRQGGAHAERPCNNLFCRPSPP